MRWCLVLGLLFTLILDSRQKKEATVSSVSNEGNSDSAPNYVSGVIVAGESQSKSPLKTTEAVKTALKTVGAGNGRNLNPDIRVATEGISKDSTLDSLERARILVILPLPFFSHTYNYMPIFKELARRGHKITMVSPYPQKEALLNWEDIATENVLEEMWGMQFSRNRFELLLGVSFCWNHLFCAVVGTMMKMILYDVTNLLKTYLYNFKKLGNEVEHCEKARNEVCGGIVPKCETFFLTAKMPSRDFTEWGKTFTDKLMEMMAFADICVELFGQMAPLQDLYKNNSREFDLVFIEPQFVQEPLLAFGWKFKVPVISLYPSYIVPELAYYTGNPVFTTNYVPHMFFDASNKMNLYQRFENTAYSVLKLIIYNGFYLPRMDSFMRKYFPSQDTPYIADLLFNVSFTLLDSNPVLVYPYPRSNNIREFLGINTKSDTPLSQELLRIMDEGYKDGIILFTMGSHYQTSTLKPHILESVLYAFSQIPQKVIMKWDKDEPPPNLPANVYTVKWVPQAGILRHENCRAFFTHAGVHGVMEAMDHGVPLIALPLFADQSFFATWAEENGVGKKLDHETITPQIAMAVVKEVLNNPKYKENAVGVSIKLKDVSQPTIDEVVYWVEHVLRTKGARHLRPGSLNLWWYQRFGLDVLAVALVLFVVPMWVFFAVIRCLCLMCRRKGETTNIKKGAMKLKKEN